MNRKTTLFLSPSRCFRNFLGTVAFLVLVSQSWAGLGIPPIILIPPQDQKVVPGSDAHFSVEIDVSLTPLSYQWQFKGVDIPNATSKTYVRSNAQSTHAGTYSVKVTNGGGTETRSASLSLDNTRVRITSAALNGDGLQLNITGPLVATYIIETSQDLKNWTAISTNLVLAGILDFTVSKTSLSKSARRHYRVRVQ